VRVIDVIIRADTLFEELTVCSNWHHSIDAVDEKPVVG
jgi:hypothetical protein